MPQIFFYTSKNGKCPLDDFFNSLPDPKTRAKVISIIKRLESSGSSMLKPPEAKKLTDNIWELRIKYNKNSYRVLFFTQPDETYVLTNGFIKKTDKTPENEKLKAETCRKEYLQRL